MTDKNTSCCSSKSKTFKYKCPVCQQVALDVSARTMLHHIKDIWKYDLKEEKYYFCRTDDCNVVYFTENGESLDKSEIRTLIGIKEKDDRALICYCFGVNKTVAASDKMVKDFVIKQTKESNCACEIENPSGRCCLKDFPKFI